MHQKYHISADKMVRFFCFLLFQFDGCRNARPREVRSISKEYSLYNMLNFWIVHILSLVGESQSWQRSHVLMGIAFMLSWPLHNSITWPCTKYSSTGVLWLSGYGYYSIFTFCFLFTESLEMTSDGVLIKSSHPRFTSGWRECVWILNSVLYQIK